MQHDLSARRRRVLMGLAALAGVFLALATAQTSQAATITGYEQVYSPASSSHSPFQTAFVACSPGKQVLGPGGIATPGRVALDDIEPGLSGVATQAFATQFASNNSWGTSAYAVCAKPLPRRQVVSAVSAMDSNTHHTVTAECPSGTYVIGSGAALSGANGGAVLDDLIPASNLRSVTATGYEADFGTSNNWSIRAYAVCAEAPAGIHMVTAEKVASSELEIVRATCSAGYKAIGGGAEVTNGRGNAWISSSGPDTQDHRTWRASGRLSAVKGAPEVPWILNSYAICAIA